MLKSLVVMFIGYLVGEFIAPHAGYNQPASHVVIGWTPEARKSLFANYRRYRLARIGFALCTFIIAGVELDPTDPEGVQAGIMFGIVLLNCLISIVCFGISMHQVRRGLPPKPDQISH